MDEQEQRAYDSYAIDDEDRPVYRSGATTAFTQWSDWNATLDEVGHHAGAPGASAPHMRCTLPDAWDESAWEMDEAQADLLQPTVADAPPSLQLAISLTPHREGLVSSLRQFGVAARLIDAATGAITASFDHMRLRARLVFADDGLPVPAQSGEAPLSGEVECKQALAGECHFLLRTAALSYKHGRRAFAVRVDVEGLPAGCPPVFAVSAAVRSVARLPNESRPPAQAQTQPAGAAASHMDMAVSTIPATSAIGVAPALAAPARRAPAEPTVADCGDEDNSMMMVEEDDVYGEAARSALVDEMTMQSGLIQQLLAQQHQMLHEIDGERARLHALGALPADNGYHSPCMQMVA